MNENIKRTEISELGEFGLIEHLTEHFEIDNIFTVKGVGDDAAVIDNGNKLTVITTDMLVEQVHFDLQYMPMQHLGYKSVIANLSDIYAMNATPHQITVSLAISNRFSLEALEELYAGIKHACEKYDVDLVGGDTTSSVKGLIISVTAIGDATEDEIVYRSGAKEGDLICVSGDLGAAYLGLQLLEREKKIYLENPSVRPDLQNRKYIVGRQLKPDARKDIISYLKENNILPTAMIDISDGLSSEILHICKQSNCGAFIYESKIPIHEETYEMAMEFRLDPTMCALSGGEDYELLFTVKQGDAQKIMEHSGITIIGKITNAIDGAILETKSGSHHVIIAQGWNALKE
ncbi:MAG: thiamine-phosphate kinase [Fimbriimonadaceae bacterium]|nr:thiamine-phosphate kinase [Chitinophagales bacterium]